MRRTPLALAILAAACALAPAAQARPGDIDPSFGVGGESLVALDWRFGDFGRMALQRDGGIVATTMADAIPEQPVAVRLTRDGRLDRSFGSNGVARLPVAHVTGEPVVQADGRIVLPGVQQVPSGGYSWKLAAVRLEADGDLDRSFGDGGVAKPGLGARFHPFAAIQQADGGLVFGGGVAEATLDDAFALIRLERDGSLDRSFGDDGLVRTSNGQEYGGVMALVERGDGRLLAGGNSSRQVTTSTESYLDDDWVLRQYSARGALDGGFGSGGLTRVELDDHWGSFFDRLLPAGDGFVGVASSALRSTRPTHISLGRFDSSGRVDGGFGTGGLLHTQVVAEQTGRPSVSSSGDAAMQRDGKLLVGGGYSDSSTPGSPSGWLVARFREDGSADTGFGRDGVVTSPRGLFQSVRGIEVQPGGRIVAGGTSTDCGRPVFTLVRYLAEDGPDGGPAMRACGSTVGIEPDGDLPIPIQCPFVEDLCNGEVAVEIPRPDLPVGTRRFKLAGGARGTATVRARGKALRLLRSPGTRRVVAVFTARDGERHRRVIRRGIKVRAKR